jgi:hypothetical protein
MNCVANQKERPSPAIGIVNRVVSDIPIVAYVSVQCDVAPYSRFDYRCQLSDSPVKSTFVSSAPAAMNDMEAEPDPVTAPPPADVEPEPDEAVPSESVDMERALNPHSLTDGSSKHCPNRFQPLLLPELLNVYGFYVGDVSDDITNFDTSITV